MDRKDERKRRMPAQDRGSGSEQEATAWAGGRRPETEGVHVREQKELCLSFLLVAWYLCVFEYGV